MIVETVFSLRTAEAMAIGVLVAWLTMFLDFAMHYKNVLYWVRLGAAMYFEKGLIKAALSRVNNAKDRAAVMNSIYKEIAKRNFLFTIFVCNVCLSFYVLIPIALYFDLSIQETIISYLTAFNVFKLY